MDAETRARLLAWQAWRNEEYAEACEEQRDRERLGTGMRQPLSPRQAWAVQQAREIEEEVIGPPPMTRLERYQLVVCAVDAALKSAAQVGGERLAVAWAWANLLMTEPWVQEPDTRPRWWVHPDYEAELWEELWRLEGERLGALEEARIQAEIRWVNAHLRHRG